MSAYKNYYRMIARCGAVFIAVSCAFPALAQEVIWDRQYRLGNLVAFQSANDPTRYHYAGTRARVARDGGLPKFSFVRFTRKNPDGGDAIGGGIVHALVELGVTEEDLQAARDALRDIDTEGTLEGPVAFSSGTFTLISTAMNDEANEIARRVVGTGKAPLLEGDRAAVSMLLTEEGANTLWATFNTPTPDISFSFNMAIDAYRSPIQASLVADWDKIYEHDNFQAAFRTGIDSSEAQVMLGGEIDLTYDELGQSGAIDIQIIGEDESIERATQAAYEDLRKIMFAPANMAGEENFTPEYLDGAYSRATEMFDKAEANRQKRNDEARRRRDDAEEAQAACAAATVSTVGSEDHIARLEEEAKALEVAAADAQAEFVRYAAVFDRAVLECTVEENCEEMVEMYDETLSEMQNEVNRADNAAASARQRADALVTQDTEKRADAAGACSKAESLVDAAEWEQGTQVTVSAYVAYRMKRVKQTGTFEQNMNKYKADTFSLRFDSNVGDMRRYLNNDNVFVVIPDDPLVFGQNDVFVDVSGIGSTDFGDFLTSTSIELRKEHQGGDVTRDSVRLSRSTFNDPNVRMSYISRGDTDADAFERYQYKVDWNYAGNVRIPGEWTDNSGNSIPVSPPLVKQSIQFNLDPVFADELGIVGVTIRTFGVYSDQRGVGPVLLMQPDGGANGYTASGYILVDPNTGLVDYAADITLSSGGTERIERRTSSAIEVISRL